MPLPKPLPPFDSASAIQASLNGSSCPVVLPAGTVYLGAALALPSGCTLAGSPNGGTVLTPMPNAANGAIEIFNKNNVAVSGITFANFANPSNVIAVYKSKGVVVDACVFKSIRGIAVMTSTSSDVAVKRCSFADCGEAFKSPAVAFCCGAASGNSGNSVRNCVFANTGLDCVSFDAQTNCVAADNASNGSGAAMVYVRGSSGVIIKTNSGQGNDGNGIDVFESSRVTVSGNAMTNNGAAGIGIFGCNNVVVENNVCKLNTTKPDKWPFRGGIAVTNTTRTRSSAVSARNNDVSDNRVYGFYVDKRASLTTFGNRVSNNAVAAVAYVDFVADPNKVLASAPTFT